MKILPVMPRESGSKNNKPAVDTVSTAGFGQDSKGSTGAVSAIAVTALPLTLRSRAGSARPALLQAVSSAAGQLALRRRSIKLANPRPNSAIVVGSGTSDTSDLTMN